jgi:hypothetical protein
VLDKFTFYDFLGYLLPGATVVLTIYWVGKWAFGVQFPDLQTDLGTSFLFLGLSYVVGHLVQGLGSLYEGWLNKPWGYCRLSERLLWPNETDGLDDQQRLAVPVRSHVLSAAAEVFKLTDDDHAAVFEQCYALVEQQGFGQLTSIYLALNGLARGLVIASGVGLLAGIALIVRQLVIFTVQAAGGPIPATGPWSSNWQQYVIGSVMIVVLTPVALLMMREFDRFRGYFARSVYYNFLAWYRRQKLDAAGAPTSPPSVGGGGLGADPSLNPPVTQ